MHNKTLRRVFMIATISLLTAALGASAVAFGSLQSTASLRIDRPTESAIAPLLDRRAAAVMRHDEAAFMADVDESDPAFARDQRQVYLNLIQLGLSSFTLSLTMVKSPYLIPDQPAFARLMGLTSIAVTVRYAIIGLDTKPVAAPWVPIVGFANGRWFLVGESHDIRLPVGAGGQPWEGGPIAVKSSAHVALVLSDDRLDIASRLLSIAERALRVVHAFRPTGWDGTILMTAVDSPAIFESYFRRPVPQFAAATAPAYNAVTVWNAYAQIVTGRIILNPEELTLDDGRLLQVLTHEFTHVAMETLTNPATPAWLVEGTADYVAYPVRRKNLDAETIAKTIRRIGIPNALPTDGKFYSNNDYYYLAWLACRMIVEKYGRDKLIALYASFLDPSTILDDALRNTLNLSTGQFTDVWRAYLKDASPAARSATQ